MKISDSYIYMQIFYASIKIEVTDNIAANTQYIDDYTTVLVLFTQVLFFSEAKSTTSFQKHFEKKNLGHVEGLI